MSADTAHTADLSRPPRFADTLADLLDRVEYRRVDLACEADPVYRLRYDAYRREEFIPTNSQQIAGDKFDYTPNAYCFGVSIDGKLVSSVRFHHVSPEARWSPSRTIWPDILDPLLDSGESYIDPSRFTADQEASLAFPALPFLTLRIVTMASEFFGVRYCLHSVREEHAAFYVRMFGSKERGELRSYEGLDFPVVMYMADIPAVRDKVKRRFPIFMSTEEEREALFGTGDQIYERRIAPSALTAYRKRYREENSAA